ncbi:MAG: hypothetical protein V2J07_04380 [Anaerolineae bacterium]|jgi:hypothetical protein|nr:hypothetical protein [Anaerolineae bacterium]
MRRSKPGTFPWQVPTAIIFLVLGITGLLWGLLPPASETVILQLQEIRIPLEDGTFAMLQESYQMVIHTPPAVKAGQQFAYSFQLLHSDQPLNITFQDVNIFDYYQINLTLEPDFDQTTINPPGTVTTALQPGQEPVMQWKMEPVDRQPISGIFWVRVDFIPLEPDLEASSTALLARQVSIPVATIFGVSTRGIILISTILTVAAIFLGLPQLPLFKGDKDDRQR